MGYKLDKWKEYIEELYNETKFADECGNRRIKIRYNKKWKHAGRHKIDELKNDIHPHDINVETLKVHAYRDSIIPSDSHFHYIHKIPKL